MPHCKHCHFFDGMSPHWGAAFCNRGPGYSATRANPKDGCCGWEREPGADDDVESPPRPPALTPDPLIGPPKPAPVLLKRRRWKKPGHPGRADMWPR